MSSPRTSSRDHSPNSVLSKNSLLFCRWTLSSDVFTWDCCCRRCCRCCRRCRFSRRPGFYPHCEGNGSPMHAWRFIFVSTLFGSCESYSWYSTVTCEDSQHRLWEVFFIFAQWWTVINNSRLIRIHTGCFFRIGPLVFEKVLSGETGGPILQNRSPIQRNTVSLNRTGHKWPVLFSETVFLWIGPRVFHRKNLWFLLIFSSTFTQC